MNRKTLTMSGSCSKYVAVLPSTYRDTGRYPNGGMPPVHRVVNRRRSWLSLVRVLMRSSSLAGPMDCTYAMARPSGVRKSRFGSSRMTTTLPHSLTTLTRKACACMSLRDKRSCVVTHNSSHLWRLSSVSHGPRAFLANGSTSPETDKSCATPTMVAPSASAWRRSFSSCASMLSERSPLSALIRSASRTLLTD